MRKLAAIVTVAALVVAMTPLQVLAATPSAVGAVRGTVIETSGRPLEGVMQAQLTDGRGIAVPGMTVAVQRDGAFAFDNVAPGVYTVRILGAPGSSAVVVNAGRVAMATVSVSVPAPMTPAKKAGLSTTTKWLIFLAAAGGGGGAWAWWANRNDASGSK